MAWAQHDLNMPIIQTKYTADPAPYVHGDTVYLYTTHDEDDAEGFKMRDSSNGTRATTVPGLNAWWSATANGICIVPSMATASACW